MPKKKRKKVWSTSADVRRAKKRARTRGEYAGSSRMDISGSNIRTGGYSGMELKFLDTAWNAVAMATSTDGSGGELQPSSGCTNAISIPAQGDGESNRDGRKYTLKQAWFSGTVNSSPLANQADVSEFGGYFFAMVLDTQANGATVASEDVYINPSTLAAAMLPQPLRNLQNVKRFRVLDTIYIEPADMYSSTDGTNTASLSHQRAPVVNLNWKGHLECTATGTTADVASASDNAIHIIVFAGDTTLAPVLTGKCRVRFTG